MHTIELTKEDLAGAVRVWWIRPGLRKIVQIVSMHGATFIEVKTRWPAGVHPDRHEGWGELGAAFRITWVDLLERAVVLPGVPVPDLTPRRATKRGGLPKVAVGRAVKGSRTRIRAGGLEYLVKTRALRRALRLGPDPRVSPDGPTVFAFSKTGLVMAMVSAVAE